MRAVVIFLAVGATTLFSACAKTVDFATLAPESRAEIADRSEGNQATIVLQDGTRFGGRNLMFSGDVVSWTAEAGGQPERAEARSISEIRFPSSGSGALKGAGVGLLLGVVAATASEEELIVLLTAPLGALVGMFVGGKLDVVYRATGPS